MVARRRRKGGGPTPRERCAAAAAAMGSRGWRRSSSTAAVGPGERDAVARSPLSRHGIQGRGRSDARVPQGRGDANRSAGAGAGHRAAGTRAGRFYRSAGDGRDRVAVRPALRRVGRSAGRPRIGPCGARHRRSRRASTTTPSKRASPRCGRSRSFSHASLANAPIACGPSWQAAPPNGRTGASLRRSRSLRSSPAWNRRTRSARSAGRPAGRRGSRCNASPGPGPGPRALGAWRGHPVRGAGPRAHAALVCARIGRRRRAAAPSRRREQAAGAPSSDPLWRA